MRAAIYARYSSENQRETSLKDQERLCRQEAERLGYTVVKVYKDAALSGQLGESHRPGFHFMMEAARAHEFDVLITDEISRLSRDDADALKILQRLEFLRIGLVTRDGTNTLLNPQTRLLAGIKAVMSDQENRDKAHRTWRGLQGAVLRGYSPGGLPYGYRSEPVLDERNRVEGYRRLVYEPEAEIVRRVFRLYVGDEDGHPHSAREIAMLLNEDGIAPPGARWRNRTVRQAKTWSYTTIVGHRRLHKGILNNVCYAGQLVWNHSEWERDPDTKKYRYTIRPESEWVKTDAPELRIVPQDLWERVQVRMALHDVPRANGRRNVGKYLLSGFVRCAECGGSYIKTNHSYRCGNHRNRGDRACTNNLGVTSGRLERIVLQALRERLYAPANLKTLIAHVRDELMKRMKHETRPIPSDEERSKQLCEVEREIENIREAIKRGILTETTKEMLEDAECRRRSLEGKQETLGRPVDVQPKLERVLAELPERVQVYLEDLETLLAQKHIEEGKNILASLGTEIYISPDGRAEIRGDLRQALVLVSGRQRESVISWLGEEDSNPR